MSNERECKAWANCTAGTYVSRAGSQKANRACTACGSGKFTNASNLEECRKWTACSGLDEELAEGTASSDRVCGVDKKTLLKMAGLYAGALIVTLIIKYLFTLGFGAGMIIFFAALLAGWKLAYPEIGNSSADNSNNSNDPS